LGISVPLKEDEKKALQEFKATWSKELINAVKAPNGEISNEELKLLVEMELDGGRSSHLARFRLKHLNKPPHVQLRALQPIVLKEGLLHERPEENPSRLYHNALFRIEEPPSIINSIQVVFSGANHLSILVTGVAKLSGEVIQVYRLDDLVETRKGGAQFMVIDNQ
jgi:hypothetical protein